MSMNDTKTNLQLNLEGTAHFKYNTQKNFHCSKRWDKFSTPDFVSMCYSRENNFAKVIHLCEKYRKN